MTELASTMQQHVSAEYLVVRTTVAIQHFVRFFLHTLADISVSLLQPEDNDNA